MAGIEIRRLGSRIFFQIGCIFFDRQLPVPVHLNSFVTRQKTCAVTGPISARKVEAFSRNFRLLLNLMQRDGTKPLVVLQDTSGRFQNQDQERAFFALRDAVKRLAVLESVRVLDMIGVTKSDPKYFKDVIHMNELGNEVRAKAIGEVVLEMLGS